MSPYCMAPFLVPVNRKDSHRQSSRMAPRVHRADIWDFRTYPRSSAPSSSHSSHGYQVSSLEYSVKTVAVYASIDDDLTPARCNHRRLHLTTVYLLATAELPSPRICDLWSWCCRSSLRETSFVSMGGTLLFAYRLQRSITPVQQPHDLVVAALDRVAGLALAASEFFGRQVRLQT